MPFRRNIRKRLEVGLTRLGLAVVPRLPRGVVLALARAMGTAGYVLSARNRRLGRANLDLAFGGNKTAAEKRRILRKSLQNFALVTLDLLWFSRDSEARMARWFVAGPRMQEAMARKVARVGVTGHFGNWELVGATVGDESGRADERGDAAEESGGGRAVAAGAADDGPADRGAGRGAAEAGEMLREGGTVGLLLDQNTDPDEGGVFAEFFGKPVAVSPAAGILAPMTGAEIVFTYALHSGDGTYRGELTHVIPAEEIAALERGVAAQELTQRVTTFYEEAIRSRPECWLWSYKRWRHIPEGMARDGFPYYAK
jgi:Kdo2-lipid IVA lauroyltransferase/acyltransferase